MKLDLIFGGGGGLKIVFWIVNKRTVLNISFSDLAEFKSGEPHGSVIGSFVVYYIHKWHWWLSQRYFHLTEICCWHLTQ